MGMLYGLLVAIGIVAALVFVASKPEPTPEIQNQFSIEKADRRRVTRWISLSIVIVVFCMLTGSCLASVA